MPTLIMKRGKERIKGVVKIHGKVIEKLFQDSSKKSRIEAVRWEIETLKSFKQRINTESFATTGEWINGYLDFASSRFVKKTIDDKTLAFKRMAENTDITIYTPVNQITVGVAESILKKCFNDVSGYSANKVRKNLSAAWLWGAKYMDNFPSKNPFAIIDPFPEIESPRYVPSEDDFWKLFEYISKQSGVIAQQDKAILTTYLHCAGRRGEIWKLKLQDLDFHNKRIRLWTKKRKNGNLQSDWLPMTNELCETLKSWVKTRLSLVTNDKQHVFISLNKASFCIDYYGLPFKERRHFMHKNCMRAGINKPFGFHSIRHLTASILFRKGYRLGTIQAILRHQSQSTTERYLRSLGIDEVRDDLETALQMPGSVIQFQEIKKAV